MRWSVRDVIQKVDAEVHNRLATIALRCFADFVLLEVASVQSCWKVREIFSQCFIAANISGPVRIYSLGLATQVTVTGQPPNTSYLGAGLIKAMRGKQIRDST